MVKKKKCENARKYVALMCINECVWCVHTHTHMCLVAQSCLTLRVPVDCSPPEYWSGLPFTAPGCLFLLFTLYTYVQFIYT